MTELCEIAETYGTDKCPQIKHHYTEFYYEMFKDKRETIRKVIEIGIGLFPTTKNIVGPSLRMWRDFFPNAMIYGADIDPELIFEDERIKTFLCDQNNKVDLHRLIANTGKDIDLFIDDATHLPDDQIFTAKTVFPLLSRSCVYIIEDVNHRARERIVDTLSCSFSTEILRPRYSRYKDDCLLVLRRQS